LFGAALVACRLRKLLRRKVFCRAKVSFFPLGDCAILWEGWRVILTSVFLIQDSVFIFTRQTGQGNVAAE